MLHPLSVSPFAGGDVHVFPSPVYNDPMTTEFWLLLGVIFIGLFLIYWLLSSELKKLSSPQTDPNLVEWLKSLSQTVTSTNQNVTSTLQRSYSDLHARLENATQVIGELKREAGAFSEIGRSMKDLQDLLKSPKLRGTIGEQVLKDLISQMFPKQSVFLQHRFKTGSIVDAAIQTDAGILPIDSKFPMENFQKMCQAATDGEREVCHKLFVRDVKKHISDISSKYILPSEGTMDFALMYLPSESIYYEVASDASLLEEARNARVYPVSPTTLYAHLQTILLSFEGKKIETKSRQVFALLRGIQKDYTKLEEQLGVLSRHLTNAYTQMNNTHQLVDNLGNKLLQTQTLNLPEEE